MATPKQKSSTAPVENQPPLRINENPRASTLAQALANVKAQVEAAKQKA